MIDRIRITATLAMALAAPAAFAQATTPDSAPSAATTAGTATKEAPIPRVSPDLAGQEGSFRPSPTDAVVVPGFTPTTPGVTPMDTPTNATVGSTPSDRALRDSVAGALAADPALQGATLNVTVRNGVVSVTGSARDRTQADRARALAEGTVGVSRVSTSISTGG
jgi:hypothetical protein